MGFVIYVTVGSVLFWLVASFASRGLRPDTTSYSADHARQGVEMFAYTSVVVPVVGVPATAVAARTDGLLPPLLVAVVAFAVALVLVHLLGRRFPSVGLPKLR